MNNYNLLSVFDLLVDHNDKMFTKCNSVRNICYLESLYQITTIFATSWRNSRAARGPRGLGPQSQIPPAMISSCYRTIMLSKQNYITENQQPIKVLPGIYSVNRLLRIIWFSFIRERYYQTLGDKIGISKPSSIISSII